ncbi:MAG: regulatory protein RecX [Balneolaceae bacterium]|nr:MAG: regulatory protein RecX [Balneolaceae bacterium]
MSEYDKSAEIRNRLPLKITEITVQKKNQDRFSLFHEGNFLIGVSAKTFSDFSLQKGVELTPSLFDDISESENRHAVKESALRYLGRSDHPSGELMRKLQAKGFEESAIRIVIGELTDRGYIDDDSFAVTFAREKVEFNKWGPNKIRAALFKKKLPKDSIEKAIRRSSENLQQEQICVDLVLKRKNHFLREDDLFKRKQKIYNYLAGRGFSIPVIKKSLPLIIDALDA